jgi:hypothetical protein
MRSGIRPETYIATACRLGDHDKCRERSAVRCACVCHADKGADWIQEIADELELF